MDVAALRAEIKQWERDFRSTHGRDPSVQEIKDQPAVAAKYKLYKTLSKSASSASAPKTIGPPTTPSSQRRRQASSSVIPKSRAIKVDPPVSSSNPFSPVKNRKRLTDLPSSSQRASNPSRPNPFATPSKSKRSPHVARHSPSPDPFPPILPLPAVQRPPLSPATDSAVTRARKRLRGEAVSPSPVKEKRLRVVPQAAPSFAGRPPRSRSPEISHAEHLNLDPTDTIIADTPMKPLRSGRNFKILFEDAPSSHEPRPVPRTSSRKMADSPPPSRLGLKRDRSRALTPSSDEEEDWAAKPKLKSLEASAIWSTKPPPPKTRVVNGKSVIPKALVPTKDDLWSDLGPAKSSQSKLSSVTRQSQAAPSTPPRAPNKRALLDVPDDVIDGSRDGNTLLDLPLIPPSPPPESSTSAKGKGKPVPFGRKKAKFLQGGADAESDEAEDAEIQVREVDIYARPILADRDEDAVSGWESQWRPRQDRGPPFLEESSDNAGRFEVNLPEDLHRILAISPKGRTRETGEEKVVRSLLYGSRELHYDPSKGGEIWDVGEESEHSGETDDWEGEPVPWEVGEL